MKFTRFTYTQSRMVAGVCVPDRDYDALLREAMRIALGMDTNPTSDDWQDRYTRICELMVAYVDSAEGKGVDAPVLMARLACSITDVIPPMERKGKGWSRT
jgi:hypothetical protein